MGFLSKLFGKKETKQNLADFPDFLQAEKFNNELQNILSSDRYLARTDYIYLIEKYKTAFDFFNNKKANTLQYYCKTNKLDEKVILMFLSNYENILDIKNGSKIIEEHNESYIKKHLISDKQYLDGILSEVDPKILLDEEQRRVILSDEDY